MNTKSDNMSSTDIARRAGVSQATVSRVLSGNGYVSEKTRKKVEKLIQEMGYRPNPFARAMRTKQSGTVGVAVSRITNPIVPEILETLSQSFAAMDRRVVVWNTDAEGESGPIDAIRQGAVDGMVFTAASHQRACIQAALDEELPVVSFNRYLKDANCDQIVSTNFEGAREIAHYLVDNGRERIAFVNGPKDRTTLADREAGFRQGLNDRDRDLGERCYAAQSFEEGAFQAVITEMFDKGTPPDAIACGNDLIAFAVLNCLKVAGLRVPEDVWVTGFDGVAMASWPIIDLTTMRQPIEQMAADAAEALVRRIEGKSPSPKIIEYRAEFFPRGSTANVGRIINVS